MSFMQMSPRRCRIGVLAGLLFTLVAVAQNTPTPAEPTPPPSPVTGIRNKISAGDLLSAESILEVHHSKNGEDGQWLSGLAWLARGAVLTGDTAKARRYVSQVRAQCAERMARGVELEKDRDLEIAYGAAVEVRAQLIEQNEGADKAAEYIQSELAIIKGPASLVSRLYKRLNMLVLTGSEAPELEPGDFVGPTPPTLASLRGKPVLLFLWANWCGDCKAQAPALAHVKSRYEDRGLQMVTVTRYYEDEPDHNREKQQIDSVWTAAYAQLGALPIVISSTSMERYGGSSTPTLVFIDRTGIVRRYTPTRLTEAELVRTIDELMQ